MTKKSLFLILAITACILAMGTFSQAQQPVNDWSAPKPPPSVGEPIAPVEPVLGLDLRNDNSQHVPYGDYPTAAPRVPLVPSRDYTPAGVPDGLHYAPRSAASIRTKRRARIVWETYQESVPKEEQERLERIRITQESLLNAKTDEDRNSAAEELQEALQNQFDKDYERREKELQVLETRVARLREQLDKRKNARNEIIDVRFKTYLHQVDGLSFPDPIGNSSRRFPSAIAPPSLPQVSSPIPADPPARER